MSDKKVWQSGTDVPNSAMADALKKAIEKARPR